MAIQENPYLPPTAHVADLPVAGGPYIATGRAVPAGHAFEWIASGWRMFRRQAGIWVLLALVYGLITVGLSAIPGLGQLAGILLMPIFVGGFMLGCRRSESGEELELAHLFAGFRVNTGQLVLVGLITLALILAVMIPIVIVSGVGAIIGSLDGPGPGLAEAASALIGVLVGLGLLIPVYMGAWFAPALVILHDQSAVRAMLQSFRGCLKNIVPFLLYAVVLFVLAIIATIPAGLGWLVLGPVIVASIYAAYRDIYFG